MSDWSKDAACKDMAVEDFFDEHDEYALVREVCNACPVKRQCRAAAIAEEGSTGATGRHGYRWSTPLERHQLHRAGKV